MGGGGGGSGMGGDGALVVGSELAPLGSWEFYLNAGLALGCVTLAALAAGLTMGLVAIEPFRLQIVLETKETDCTSRRQIQTLRREQECAKKILPLITKHHLLLVTLLLLNSIANECLPLFLDEIVPTGVAIILSVTLVLLFGEIIPSAIFTGPNQLTIASRFVPVVRAAMCLMYPVARPIASMLDKLLGEEHPEKFNKAELRALVKLHLQAPRSRARTRSGGSPSTAGMRRRQESDMIRVKLEEIGVDEQTAAMAALATAAAQEAIDEEDEDFATGEAEGALGDFPGASPAGAALLASAERIHSHLHRTASGQTHATQAAEGLEVDEVLIMQGAMDLKEVSAQDRMIPLMHVYMLRADQCLTETILADIVASGHSRVLVYDGERTNIRGLLLVKKLIVINPQDARRVDTLFLRMPIFVRPETTLLSLLNLFQGGNSHMAVVTDAPEAIAEALRNDEPIPDDVNVFGICTLEDIIETLIKEDISDETDFHLSVKHSLFTQQRKQRLLALAMKQKKQRKLARSGVAALVGAKSRPGATVGSYGSLSTPPGARGSPAQANSAQGGPRTPLLGDP